MEPDSPFFSTVQVENFDLLLVVWEKFINFAPQMNY